MSEFTVLKDKNKRLLHPYIGKAPSKETLRVNGYTPVEHYTSVDKQNYVVVAPLMSDVERLTALEQNEIYQYELRRELEKELEAAKTDAEKIQVLLKAVGLAPASVVQVEAVQAKTSAWKELVQTFYEALRELWE